ncbi:lipopolysaccharide heptosyltransferase I [Candidatus Sulfurimonas marisnigri]|uniref:Lipopolysaccharide heptosyltransferase 1 n=1 Tax=Candidatus Sulfurimonas marisnigri TaxID=2740405 RepID=A0A7S7M1D9_9BACT|nr:lipopolysaccharide heptosyltransferase I [Candidatus Sulfurimonas marisnigri]QOY55223.1 lipopolysaccharide heptosyltransferase I [Candidatus Sulfurimonas marisnigri]
MRICIVKLSAMGDIIHAMVALEFIKKHIPFSQIDWIVESGFKGVLENNPHIDNILSVNLKSIKKNKLEIFTQYKLLKTYSKNNYDIIIDAQGLLKSAIVSRIIGANTIAGFDKNSIRESVASLFYNKKIHIAYKENAIDRNMAVICQSLNIKYTKNDILQKEKFLFFSQSEQKNTEPYIVLVVGASKENKVYPKEKFAAIVNKLERKTVVVWGNEEEHKTATWIAQNSDCAFVAPKGNLDALKSIIANAKMVIGGDTGPTHMAWALNIPSITIFGNTPEYRNTYATNINKVIKSSSKVDPLKLDSSDFSIRDIEVNEITQCISQHQLLNY